MTKKTQHHSPALVIVESPAKAKTINRYLGPGYTVKACMGHVRDLPPKDLGVDLEGGFKPVYEVLDAKKKVVAQLKNAAAKASEVYLATDLDREGEAIAWHLVHALGLDAVGVKRVVFNEITKSAIVEAFEHAHRLDMDKVNAQQARRILDRIVGYQLSPLLQVKIAKGLSAGRVQSVAVRLVVEREREIRAFVPEESWRICGCFATDPAQAEKLRQSWAKFLAETKDPAAGRTVKERNHWLANHACFCAELIKLDGTDCKPRAADQARAIAEALGFVTAQVVEEKFEEYAKLGLKKTRLAGRLDPQAAPRWRIKGIQTKRTASNPGPPFTTATLQQAASSALGYAPARTMRLAQQLYEGVDLAGGEGQVGLITYMRTDSVHLSQQSVTAARSLIRESYGDKYLPEKPRAYSSGKRAQEAHEAVRPTEATRTPEALKGHLSDPLLRLYDLIWRRFMACQMTPAAWDATTVHVAGDTPKGEAVFKAVGRQLVFDGYLKVMGLPASGEAVMPALREGTEVGALDLEPKQQFTSPPARYSEASLVKKLEAEGIGRPSTYATIIKTIQDRGYVDLIDRSLHPTARGEIVTDKLVDHFPGIMEYKFTSYMEDELDKIEEAHLDWVHVLTEFYEPFKKALDRAHANMTKQRGEPSEYTCPECGQGMVYRLGKKGRFLSCSGYPKCKVARNIDRDGKPVEVVVADENCPQCGKAMVLKQSRRGPFLGCTGYPQCRHTRPSDENGVPLKKIEPEDIDETCEECGSPMTVKWSRGRAFLGCKDYPKCKSTRPLPPGVYVEKPKPEEAGVGCDKCGRPMVIRKSRRGPFLSCSGYPRCRNAMPLDKLDHLKDLAANGRIPDAPLANNGLSANGEVPRTKDGKVNYDAMGPPPRGFAWTRTGRPVVETWPEDGLTCPECGAAMALKTGRFGPYWGCSDFPKCRLIANMRGEAKKRAEAEAPAPDRPKPIPTDVTCDECGQPMLIRTGRSGKFLGCSRYPKCKATKPLPTALAAVT